MPLPWEFQMSFSLSLPLIYNANSLDSKSLERKADHTTDLLFCHSILRGHLP